MSYLIGVSIGFAVFLFPIWEYQNLFLSENFYFPQINLEEISLVFVGDMMFDRDIRQIGERGGYYSIFGDSINFLNGKDLVIGNLEGPITASTSVSLGSIPGSSQNYRFTFDPKIVPIFPSIGNFLLSIGNNHMRDFGIEGIESTRHHLEENSIKYFGDPLETLGKPLFLDLKNKKISFINYNEFEGQDQKTTLLAIKNSKEKSDYVFVYAHWGNEYEPIPRDDIKILARSFIDAGADAVFGSHPHVIAEIEEYKNGRIYYSLGNFIFDQYWDKSVTCGLAVTVLMREKEVQFIEDLWGFDRQKGGVSRCMLQ